LLLLGFTVTVGGSAAQADTPSPQAASSSPVHTVRQDMDTINPMLMNHEKIVYTVKFIKGGAYTRTTSADPAMVELIRTHAVEMKARMEQGNEIRPADPVFHELFKHHSEITIKLQNIARGVEEWETSTNPQIALLIQSHTHAVSDFVKRGMPAARVMHPLPRGYHATPDTTGTPSQ
jgi:hypothetical protein